LIYNFIKTFPLFFTGRKPPWIEATASPALPLAFFFSFVLFPPPFS